MARRKTRVAIIICSGGRDWAGVAASAQDAGCEWRRLRSVGNRCIFNERVTISLLGLQKPVTGAVGTLACLCMGPCHAVTRSRRMSPTLTAVLNEKL